jgi:hypothetical protein
VRVTAGGENDRVVGVLLSGSVVIAGASGLSGQAQAASSSASG